MKDYMRAAGVTDEDADDRWKQFIRCCDLYRNTNSQKKSINQKKKNVPGCLICFLCTMANVTEVSAATTCKFSVCSQPGPCFIHYSTKATPVINLIVLL